jgi:hypothetical protein
MAQFINGISAAAAGERCERIAVTGGENEPYGELMKSARWAAGANNTRLFFKV